MMAMLIFAIVRLMNRTDKYNHLNEYKLKNNIEFDYSGFWKRFSAMIIDLIVTALGITVIALVFGFVMALDGVNDPEFMENIGNILSLSISWLYFSVMESSFKTRHSWKDGPWD